MTVTPRLTLKHLLTRCYFYGAMLLLALGASAQAQTLIPLHNFTGGTDGAFPQGALVHDTFGNLFGTTTSGGIGDGTVYRIDRSGKETVFFTFNAFVSGITPATALTVDRAGNLYGIADGGPGGAGVLFKLSPLGDQQILFAFQGGLDNHNPKVPTGGILLDKSGNLYGTTLFGGGGNCQLDCGTIYRLDAGGKFQVLYQFKGGPDGSQPFGPLVRDSAGSLYGVAQSGGDLSCPEFPQAGCGTVFKLSKTGLTVLHTFRGGKDGASPRPGLHLDAAGNVYGAAATGGSSGNGTIFRISSDGTYTVLHNFTQKEGTNPNGALISDDAGNLYGTAQLGGAQNLGTAFQLTADGQLKVLHSFTGGLDGAVPFAGLIRDATGRLFGTAVKNFLIQQIQGGSVFEIIP
jgi:uncharacterized repeat protein (TIGR03803 family)